jgi:hypothetical protein
LLLSECKFKINFSLYKFILPFMKKNCQNFKTTSNEHKTFTINALLKCTTFLENNVNGMPVQQKNIFFVTQN